MTEPLDFDEILDNYMKANKKVWEHDRSLTLGASEAFGCIRKAFFTKTGAPQDPDFKQDWGATERGNLIEDHFLVPAFEGHMPGDTEAIGLGDDQETLIDGLLSATPDGLMINLEKNALTKYGIDDIESDCAILEFKSIDPRMTLTQAKGIHAGQVQSQMGIIRKNTDYKPVYAVIMYVNASFLSDTNYFVIKFEPKKYASAKKRAKRIYAKDAKAEDFTKEGKITDSCEYCPFKQVCWDVTLKSTPTVEKKTNYEIAVLEQGEELSRRYQKAGTAEKDAKILKKEIGEEMRAFLRVQDTKKITGDTWSFSNSLQNGKTTYDMKRMEEDGIDISKYEKTGNGFEKLTVTKKKAK